MQYIAEQQARISKSCFVCDNGKEPGIPVCGECFEEMYKQWGGTFKQFQDHVEHILAKDFERTCTCRDCEKFITKDHAELKKQIKEWEQRVDLMVKVLIANSKDITQETAGNIESELESISHEMMSINI